MARGLQQFHGTTSGFAAHRLWPYPAATTEQLTHYRGKHVIQATTTHRKAAKLFRTARFLAVLLLGGNGAYALEPQPLGAIYDSVHDYLATRYQTEPDTEFSVGRIDSRLRLTKCEHPLQVDPHRGSRLLGNSTLAVSCEAKESWKIYVPVQIRSYREVLVARRALPRGSYLGESDLQLMRYEISRLHRGYFTQIGELQNMVTRRTLRRGQVLTPHSVSPPRLVRRGDAITILAKSGNLLIRVKGRALMDGQKGDSIKVRNTRSKREIQATVVAPGTVRVGL